ncbi:hypothetical protein IGB42_00339 [Andreprevotia sp. IGB-42]|uniref:hypothetical protein n=1 Tax=Andreprevotia sp. IGB-42 TaxID=2497473 RepID=UPI0013596BB7|nr:hypothetical protein [Andreprevotia sp. IGB-42]KAF0815258.1 hypothetical protein IGB42_00339 [Andreprevotia sp. IGB-42]
MSQQQRFEVKKDRDNQDPITGAAEFHPAGTAAGAAVGGAAGIGAAAAAGAAIGAAGGPAGLAVGAAVGAVVGGLAGKAAAERFNPSEEDAYWRANHAGQPYATQGLDYDAYRGAYVTGYEGRTRYEDRTFEDAENELRTDYERNRGDSELDWENSRAASRAAWDRVGQRYYGLH